MFQWQDEDFAIILEAGRGFRAIGVGKICNHCKFCFLRQQPPSIRTKHSRRWLTVEEFDRILNVQLKDCSFLKVNIFSTESVSAEFFDHPQASELSKILVDWSNARKEAMVHLYTVGVADDVSREVLTNMPKLYIDLSVNFLDPEERSRYMYTKDPVAEIDKVIKFGEAMRDKIVIASMYSTFDKRGMENTFKRYLEHFQYTIGNLTPSEVYDEKGTLLRSMRTTRYTHPIEFREHLEAMAPTIVENADLFIKTLEPIKDRLIIADLTDYFDIPTILKRFEGLSATELLYNNFYESYFTKPMSLAFEYIESEGIGLEDVAFITSEANILTAKKTYPDFNWLIAKNNFYGGTVTCAGLMTFSDVFDCIKSNKKYKLYIAPKIIQNVLPDEQDNEEGWSEDRIKLNLDLKGERLEKYFPEDSGIDIKFF